MKIRRSEEIKQAHRFFILSLIIGGNGEIPKISDLSDILELPAEIVKCDMFWVLGYIAGNGGSGWVKEMFNLNLAETDLLTALGYEEG